MGRDSGDGIMACCYVYVLWLLAIVVFASCLCIWILFFHGHIPKGVSFGMELIVFIILYKSLYFYVRNFKCTHDKNTVHIALNS